jgi:hypothetical protein
MTPNILNPNDYTAIRQRILQLPADSPRKWGKMTVSEMLMHCSLQIKLALGQLPSTGAEGPAYYRTALGRWLAIYVMPWPKGAGTPSQMNMVANKPEPVAFETAKSELLALLEQVQGQDSFSPHPFFGKMNRKDWGSLMGRHLDHHLQQFSA